MFMRLMIKILIAFVAGMEISLLFTNNQNSDPEGFVAEDDSDSPEDVIRR